ncbi:MAG TPA: NAD(P)(+) transhydrogenase (Re/Si-specific) subunit beta [Fredinandcohnia sp.]|nr:NAD(P)(+) transhydrogenase (Re/Si-specific) subunit beta [Fredinandcohnia sp.]
MSPVQTAVAIAYLASACMFIFGLKQMSRIRTARQGNVLAALAMAIAVVATLVELGKVDYRWMLLGGLVGTVVGAVAALRVAMTAMPEMVALLNGAGGAASALVGLAFFYTHVVEPGRVGTVAAIVGTASTLTLVLSLWIGAVTASGSLIAYAKLSGRMRGAPVLLPGRHALNVVLIAAVLGLGVIFGWVAPGLGTGVGLIWILFGLSLLLGVSLVLPIGGADMPVVVSLLNSYSGVAASMTGFVIGNNLLIIAGAMVGAAGLILTQIMCKAMNRSLANVVLGGFGGGDEGATQEAGAYQNVRSAGPEEMAMVLEAARKVVVVPGYGLAVAQAQHAVRELADLLEQRGIEVAYAIHPVAGRMPGHMNVLLAEADVPYEHLWELERANSEMKTTDVVIVLGANDVVNPAAQSTPNSPIYGMPIIEAHQAKSVFVVKRSLGAGYAGIKNELFEHPNTNMVFGDAKKVLQDLIAELKSL